MHHAVLQDGIAGHLAHGHAPLLQRAAQQRVQLFHIRIHPGQHAAEQLLIPFFQRLGHNGVVGVGKGIVGNLYCVGKRDARLFDQQAQQLGNGHCGVGIVELYRVCVGKMGEIPAMGRAVSTHHVLQRRAGEEILLLEAQALACVGVVVGVQHTADIFGGVPLAHGGGIFLGVEQIEIECLERLGLPQTQCIDGFHSVADDRRVVRHGAHGLPAELHSDGILLPANAPWISKALPVIGGLFLEAILKILPEQAVLVPDAVAVQRHALRGGGIQKARGQAAQAAVAQRRVLDLFKHVRIHTRVQQHLLHLAQAAHVQQIGVNEASHKKLRRKVRHALARRALPCVRS